MFILIILIILVLFIVFIGGNKDTSNIQDEDSLTEELLLYGYLDNENQESDENYDLDEFDREIEAQEDFEEELLDDLYRNDLGEDQLDEFMNEM